MKGNNGSCQKGPTPPPPPPAAKQNRHRGPSCGASLNSPTDPCRHCSNAEEAKPPQPSVDPVAQSKPSGKGSRLAILLIVGAAIYVIFGLVGLCFGAAHPLFNYMESDAVVSFPWLSLLGGCLGLSFLVLAGFFVGVARAESRRQERDSTALLEAGYPLEPHISGSWKFGGVAFFATFWNGLLVIITSALANDPTMDNPVAIVVLGIFVLLGIGFFFLTGKTTLGMLNGRVYLALNQPMLKAGQAAEVTWILSGRVSDVERLHLSLECVEETDDDSGSSTVTHREVLFETPIAEETDSAGIERGSALVIVPPSYPATFDGDDNRIVWAVRVRGEINRWPDIDEEFRFVVAA